MFTDVSEERTDSVFRIGDLYSLTIKNWKFLRNVNKHLPSYTTSHPRTQQSLYRIRPSYLFLNLPSSNFSPWGSFGPAYLLTVCIPVRHLTFLLPSGCTRCDRHWDAWFYYCVTASLLYDTDIGKLGFKIQYTLANPDRNMKNAIHSWVHTLKDT
jgi:hypothetical protein